ncbi:MAG: glycosyltransferase [Candidatus Competibacter sp.]|nr:glycosyltransferase [Candidatus Competibacter sp.]
MISVVIPTFNRRHKIGQAISSVLDQQEVEVEVIVVDDGSTDGTADWLVEEYANQPVRIVPNTRKKGPAGARNTGILVADGDSIALLDSDDCFLPHHLADCQCAFESFPEVSVVFGPALYERNGQPVDYMGPNFVRKLGCAPTVHQDGNLRVFAPNFFTHLLQYGCYFNLSTVVLRAGAARELMNEALRIAEDYEFWMRLSRTHRFACLNRPQIRYQLHSENISFEQADSAADNAPNLLAAYRIIRAYPALERKQIRLIEQNIAEVLFSWAYRCRKHRQLGEATRLHLRSFRFGKRRENAAALLKLLLVSLFPALEPLKR